MSRLHRIIASAFAVLACVAFFTAAAPPPAHAAATTAELRDTGVLAGTVKADGPFTAARVYAWNAERRMTYMVYTHEGRFRAPNLMPGRYQVRVEHAGFAAEPREVTVEPRRTTEAELRMTRSDEPVVHVAGEDSALQAIEAASYEEIYPAGPARVTIEQTCITCHGVNHLPGRPMSREGWDAVLNLMLSDAPAYGVQGGAPLIPLGTVSDTQRAELLDYLVANFGPDSTPRAVLMDQPLALDEAALSKAMWVEYTVAEPTAANGQNRWIQEPYFDLQGNVWLTERTRGAAGITRLDPRTATFTKFPTPKPNWSPHGLAVDPLDAEGSVWWGGRDIHLGRLNPKTGEMKPYPAPGPGLHGHTPVFDSKGDLWFSMLPGNRIGKWTRATDSVKLWEIPTRGGRPYGILIDQQDKIWFVEFHSCQVTRFDPETETFRSWLAPSAPCTIRRIGLDSKGRIWYGAFSSGKLGRLDPSTGEIVEFPIGRFSEPYDVWADPWDDIWISDGGQGGVLVRYDQRSGRFTNYPSPMRSDMPKIAITREGAIWYSNRSIAMNGSAPATVGVLYPDVSKMTGYGAYYALQGSRAVGSGSPRPPVRR